MRVPQTVDGPYFPHSEFINLVDALDYASAMSHDIHCGGELILSGIEQYGDGDYYHVSCDTCGEGHDISPVVYYRYRSRWEPTPDC